MSGFNTGTLTRARHRPDDSHPEFTGSLNVEGRDYWLHGWVRVGSEGRFFSLEVTAKEGDDATTIERFKAAAREHFGPLAEDLPF